MFVAHTTTRSPVPLAVSSHGVRSSAVGPVALSHRLERPVLLVESALEGELKSARFMNTGVTLVTPFLVTAPGVLLLLI